MREKIDDQGEEQWRARAQRRQGLWELAFSRRRDSLGVNTVTEGKGRMYR